MKSTGVVKNLDASYRISIPPEIREKLDIKKGDAFEIFLGKRGQIILVKAKETN